MSNENRAAYMEMLYRSGKTLQEIGDLYQITRERVRQILHKRGISAKEGGAHLKAFINAVGLQDEYRKKIEIKERWSMDKFGCSLAEYKSYGDWKKPKTPAGIFYQQRSNATRRKIGWELSLPQWWRLWQESGRWPERGRGKYVMARFADTGPYSEENIQIITQSDNSKECRFMDKVLGRKTGFQIYSDRRKLLTHCKRGHLFSTQNTIIQPTGRACRACQNAWRRNYYHKHKKKHD